MVSLVIVADDCGISLARTEGIVHAMLHGLLSHTSLMVNMPHSRYAVKLLRHHGLLGRVGLHLNLTEGVPLSPTGSVPSLVMGTMHEFLGKDVFRTKCISGKIDVDDVYKEVTAQLTLFREYVGQYPQHVDAHQHVHILPPLVPTIGKLLQQHGVTFVRAPVQHVLQADAKCVSCAVISRYAAAAQVYFRACGLRCLDAFVGLTFCNDVYTVSDVVDAVKVQLALGATSIEMMTHPGLTDLIVIDSFGRSTDRPCEVAVLCDPLLRSRLSHYVHVVEFDQLLVSAILDRTELCVEKNSN